jgi:phage anti-repressor protein/phage antirepressor YoqD-like protein
MNQLIPIHNDDERFPVDARELHAGLGSKSQFTNWFERRVKDHGFEEGTDWKRAVSALNTNEYCGESELPFIKGPVRYIVRVTIGMAKELAMLESNETGRKVRRYFIEVEQRSRAIPIPTRTEALRMALEASERADVAEAKVNRFLESEGCSSMRAAAAMFGTGRTRFFRKLRIMGIIEPAPSTMPYQKYIDAGYFVIRSKVQELTDGNAKTWDAAAVTPKGMMWLDSLGVDWAKDGALIGGAQ